MTIHSKAHHMKGEYEMKDPNFKMTAFPNGGQDEGMELRDWFAGHAMAAALTQSTAGKESDFPQMFEYVSKLAYMAADAMIKERNR